MLVALLLIPLLAMAAVVVDLGGWYARAAAIQRAADAAALAGVTVLPQGITAATNRAVAVARENGFVNGADGITITVSEAGPRQLSVDIVDTEIEPFFTQAFGTDVDITRTATAEYILPVPMGSPRNFLGTNTLPPGTMADENFWLSVSGACAAREQGDRITPLTDANYDPTSHIFQGCTAGTGGVRANLEHGPSYLYGVEFPVGGGTHNLEVFDAPHCQALGTGAGDDAAHATATPEYTYTVFGPSLVAGQGAVLFSITLGEANCNGAAAANRWDNRWRSLLALSPPAGAATTYYLGITPVVPANRLGETSQEGQNQLALRVNINGGGFEWCTSDTRVAVVDAPFNANCPNVFGVTDLGVKANAGGSDPSFFLASIGAEHGGKIMEVELFDSAEGAEFIRLLDPDGNRARFTWEIACQDGAFRSDNGGSCPNTPGENPPPGPQGYGPVNNVTEIAVAGTVGTANRPWAGRNDQNGRYSDRAIRLRLRLPDDITAAYGGDTWWRIQYDVGGSVNDRTTWTVSIKGDPVRLIPNP